MAMHGQSRRCVAGRSVVVFGKAERSRSGLGPSRQSKAKQGLQRSVDALRKRGIFEASQDVSVERGTVMRGIA